MSKAMMCVAALAVLIGATGARGEALSGSVVNQDGTAAAGARVWVVRMSTQRLDRIETVAGDQGRFTLDLPPGGWLIEASNGDQGLATLDFVEIVAGREPRTLALRLSPQGLLRGRLLEAETGRPIVGGRFVLDNGLAPTSDEEGRFEVPALSRTGNHEAIVVAPGRERKRVLFEMSEGPTTALDVFVPRGGKAIGRVVDLDGAPIAGASVGRSTSGSIASLTGLWTRVDEDGQFEYDGLPLDRTTWLNAEAPGFEGVQRDGVVAASGGEPLSIEFRMARKPGADARKNAAAGISTKADAPSPKVPNRRNVSGVVLSPDGKPVPRATARWGVDWSNETIETKTDADGSFRLALVPVEPGLVCVIPENAELAPEVEPVAGGGDQDVRVSLVKGHGVKGVVQDDQGAPFADVMVLPTVAVPGQRELALWERRATTDARGRFEVTGLPSDGVKFTFLREGVSDLRDHALELDKEAVVVMTAAGAIRGKVVDANGAPVRNFRVLLNSPRDRKPDDQYGGFFAGFCGIGLSYSSDDGSFLVRNLGAESVQRVTVLAPGHGEVSIDRVVAEPLNRLTPDQALTFQVAKPNTLRVHVVEEETGEPIPGARVSLIFEDPAVDANFAWGYHDTAWGDSVHARSDAQGVADFTPLSFGEGTLLIQAPGYARRNLGWRDKAEDVTVKLAPEAAVSGELIDAETGKPLDQAVVRVAMIGGGSHISASVSKADAGRFQIGELPAGEYGLSVATPSGTDLHTERITLEAGRRETRTLKLSRQRAAEAAAAPRAPVRLFKVGDAAPEFDAKTLDDKPISLKDFRGKYVLLDFWATWCGPCVAEIPQLQAVHEAFGDDDRFAMISLSLDPSKDAVVKFLKEKDLPWRQVFLGDWSTDEVTKKYGVEAIPTILLLDPDGKIAAQDLRGAAIKEAVAKALGKD